MKFRNEYWFLSNMYPTKFEVNEIVYNSSENFYQAHKTTNKIIHRKLATVSPLESKKLGRTITFDINYWNDNKVYWMRQALYHKFTSDKKLFDMLKATNDIKLIEDNTWYDTFWGVCNGRGMNVLGELLMEQRNSSYKSKVLEVIVQ